MIEEPKVVFARYVEDKVSCGAGYIDAVCQYCIDFNIESEAAAALVKKVPGLKLKMQVEALELRLVTLPPEKQND